jgi:hypothetical protein
MKGKGGIKMAKETKLTEGTWNALNTMRKVDGEVTMAQLNELSEDNIASAHMTQLKRRGLVTAEKREFVCDCCGAKSKRNVYTLTEAGALYQEDAE